MSFPALKEASGPPELPETADLEAPSSSLSFATPASDRPVRLDGSGATVHAHERLGVGSVRFADTRMGPFEIELGVPANCVISPRHFTRELVGSSGSSLERTFVPSGLPLMAFQWRPGIEGPAVPVFLHLGSGHSWSQVEIGPGWARASAEDGALVTVGLAGTGGSVELVDRNGGAVLVCQPGLSTTATLFVGGGEAGQTLRGAKHIASHLVNSARGEREGFQLRTGVDEIDEGFAWARIRLRGEVERALREASKSPSDSEALLGLVAALAVTDVDAGRAALGTGLSKADLAWGTARFIATFARDLPPLPTPHEGVVTGRALPMAGAPLSREDWLEALGNGNAPAPIPGGLTAEEADVFQLVASMRADPDAGWAAWRARLAEGMSGATGFALWDHPSEGHMSVARSAGVLAGVGIGLLGLSPDAEVDRLRLAPAFPETINSFTVEGIEMGGSSTDFAYRRDERSHWFELVPSHGRVPPTIVFEPTVPGTVDRVLLDGSPAELDIRTHEDRTTVPLQMRLEGPRTLEIVGG